MRLTDQQLTFLKILDDRPLTSSEIADSMGVSRAGWPLKSYDQVHGAMRRLEDRELVRRAYFVRNDNDSRIFWELTKEGREALDVQAVIG